MTEVLSIEEFKKLQKKSSSKNGLRIVTKNKYLEDMKLVLKLAGVTFDTEYQFHPERKWKFDIALCLAEFPTAPVKMIAIEYEGLNSAKSRHTSVTGYTGDCEKYNEAQKLGWVVLRYTALSYTTMIDDVRFFLNK